MEAEGKMTVEEWLRRLLAERVELDRLIATLQKRLQLPATVEPEGTASEIANLPDSPISLQKGDFYGLSRPEAAIALLNKANRPLSTNEIVDSLRRAGYEMPGKNMLSAFYTALKRHSELVRVAKNTWGLRKWYPGLKEPSKRIPTGNLEREQ